MDTRITIRKFFGHLKTVLVHKYWVLVYCRKLGITWRGLTHDLSKFSPVEFWESVRYWDGKTSPIVKCKADKGYSLAWQHHKGRNRHHYEYWVDNLDQGGTPIKMPWKDMLELIADYLGAGRAYNNGVGKDSILKHEKEWFRKKIQNDHPKIHPATIKMIDFLLDEFAEDELILDFFRGGSLKKLWEEQYELMK